MLETVTRVLEQADRPMRATEIHKEAPRQLSWRERLLLGIRERGPFCLTRSGADRRFQRIGRGCYELRPDRGKPGA